MAGSLLELWRSAAGSCRRLAVSYLALSSPFMLAAMFRTAVLASVATLESSDLAASAASAEASAALSAAATVAAAAVSAASLTFSFTVSLTSLTVVAGTGAGVEGVTGEGVFHGSSIGLEAFHAATPAATAAAMTPKIRNPRCLGFCGFATSPVTARLASAAAALSCWPGGLRLLLDAVDNTGVNQPLCNGVHVGRGAFEGAVHGVGGVADLVRKLGQVFNDDAVAGVGDHRGGLVQGLMQPGGGALDGVVDLRRQLGQPVLDAGGYGGDAVGQVVGR